MLKQSDTLMTVVKSWPNMGRKKESARFHSSNHFCVHTLCWFLKLLQNSFSRYQSWGNEARQTPFCQEENCGCAADIHFHLISASALGLFLLREAVQTQECTSIGKSVIVMGKVFWSWLVSIIFPDAQQKHLVVRDVFFQYLEGTPMQ